MARNVLFNSSCDNRENVAGRPLVDQQPAVIRALIEPQEM